ncbi:MAG: hypothetical protein JSV13_10440 [Nitrospiraceae bacterium]|nr:MAG: hypothetical protein JSV13_10440 [Nitrospiraceae bacterium]
MKKINDLFIGVYPVQYNTSPVCSIYRQAGGRQAQKFIDVYSMKSC